MTIKIGAPAFGVSRNEYTITITAGRLVEWSEDAQGLWKTIQPLDGSDPIRLSTAQVFGAANSAMSSAAWMLRDIAAEVEAEVAAGADWDCAPDDLVERDGDGWVISEAWRDAKFDSPFLAPLINAGVIEFIDDAPNLTARGIALCRARHYRGGGK